MGRPHALRLRLGGHRLHYSHSRSLRSSKQGLSERIRFGPLRQLQILFVGSGKRDRADASAASHDYTFDKIIDKTEAGSDPANQYTFFIKTVYTRPDLTPTFHSMKTIEGKTTGIESVGADLDSDAPAEYFNLQGIPVANPGHGVYLRRQGTRTTKVTL